MKAERLSVTVRKGDSCVICGGRSQLMEAVGPNEDLKDGRALGTGHLVGVAAAEKM